MKQTLASLFKPYRPVLPVIAHRNVRMRGQAFVSFSDKESASRAKKDVAEFPLYGKAMVRVSSWCGSILLADGPADGPGSKSALPGRGKTRWCDG